MFWSNDTCLEAPEETSIVDNVILSRSIMSCSLVLTGAGGSGRANALLGEDVETVSVAAVGVLVFTIARSLLVPPLVLCEVTGLVLECLHP